MGYNIIATTKPKAAPLLIPNMEGLAIGLLVSPCIKAPETEKLTPQIIAANNRGHRKVCTITSEGLLA